MKHNTLLMAQIPARLCHHFATAQTDNMAVRPPVSPAEQPAKPVAVLSNSVSVDQTSDMHDGKTLRYNQLVQQYHADLYRYSYWLCKDADIAQDLVQETYLRAWKSLDSLLDISAAKAWLITILRRENARRFERKQFDYDDNAEQDMLHDTAQISAEQSCDNDRLRALIAALPEEYREPLVLQVLGGFNSEEIAGLLQLNVNTVNTRLFRARKQLRDHMIISGEQP